MEAVTEIVKQIRLRNLVGIIVVDFIDIRNVDLRNNIYSKFVEYLKNDKARSVIHGISPFGVIQLTRQRARESIQKNLVEPCPICNAMGYIKSKETIVYEVIRKIIECLNQTQVRTIEVKADEEIIDTILELEEDSLKQLKNDHSIDIEFIPIDVEDYKFEIKTQK